MTAANYSNLPPESFSPRIREDFGLDNEFHLGRMEHWYTIIIIQERILYIYIYIYEQLGLYKVAIFKSILLIIFQTFVER